MYYWAILNHTSWWHSSNSMWNIVQSDFLLESTPSRTFSGGPAGFFSYLKMVWGPRREKGVITTPPMPCAYPL